MPRARLTRHEPRASIDPVPTSLQFICNQCKALSSVLTFEQTRDGAYFCRCEQCGTKNQVVRTGQTPSQPGLLPVTGVIQ